jgi:hypothetical protein
VCEGKHSISDVVSNPWEFHQLLARARDDAAVSSLKDFCQLNDVRDSPAQTERVKKRAKTSLLSKDAIRPRKLTRKPRPDLRHGLSSCPPEEHLGKNDQPRIRLRAPRKRPSSAPVPCGERAPEWDGSEGQAIELTRPLHSSNDSSGKTARNLGWDRISYLSKAIARMARELKAIWESLKASCLTD